MYSVLRTFIFLRGNVRKNFLVRTQLVYFDWPDRRVDQICSSRGGGYVRGPKWCQRSEDGKLKKLLLFMGK